jgi:SAM-dependent methyltransferase
MHSAGSEGGENPMRESESQRKTGTTQQVRAMYEKYPYPAPLAGSSLIFDLANVVGFTFPEEDFAGKTIIDYGCGTGHRLVGLAQRFPGAKVIGIDISAASLGVAQKLAAANQVENISFLEHDIVEYRRPNGADLITSTGVVHHLADPQAGFSSISANLREDGFALIWVYHSIGEHFRLLDRDLVKLLSAAGEEEYEDGINTIRELNLALPEENYGTKTEHLSNGQVGRTSIDVDAYLHPIVRAYRFEEAVEIFHQAGMTWGCINSVNRQSESKLLDPCEKSEEPYFCLQPAEIVRSPKLIERFRALPLRKKLQVIEIAWRPTGFTCIGGKGQSFGKCGERVAAAILI